MAKINGENVNAEGMTVAAYLESAGYDPARVVVERNLEIVTKSEYAETVILAEDLLEILCFVGGG